MCFNNTPFSLLNDFSSKDENAAVRWPFNLDVNIYLPFQRYLKLSMVQFITYDMTTEYCYISLSCVYYKKKSNVDQ